MKVNVEYLQRPERALYLDAPGGKPTSRGGFEVLEVGELAIGKDAETSREAAVAECHVRVTRGKSRTKGLLPFGGRFLKEHEVRGVLFDGAQRVLVTRDAVVQVVGHDGEGRFAGRRSARCPLGPVRAG